MIGGLVSISGFFDQDFILWKFKIPKRILVPIIILIAAKIAGSLFIYYSINIQSLGTFWSDPSRVFNWPQNNVLLKYAGTAGNIPYIFVGWDSAWYLSIITHGYTFSPQAYTFMPGLPIFGYLFSLILQNPTTAIAACGLIFGVVWLPFYQLLAEVCIDKQAALASGLLIAFSPYLFVFTTIAYGEGLFLFFTLSTLYLFKKRKTAASSLLAGLAILTSVMGMALVPPMLYSSVRQKDKHRIRNIVLSVLPLAAIPLWLGYCLTSSKDLLASIHTTEWGGIIHSAKLSSARPAPDGAKSVLSNTTTKLASTTVLALTSCNFSRTGCFPLHHLQINQNKWRPGTLLARRVLRFRRFWGNRFSSTIRVGTFPPLASRYCETDA